MPNLIDAELVATGDELTSGAISDSNGAWAASALREVGAAVRRMTVVGDGLDAIVAALSEAASRAQVVVVSGGLGPTEDDRTAEAAARVAGVKLVRSEKALSHVRTIFARLNRTMTANNEKQADLPEGAEILDNPVGTAVGFAIEAGGAKLFFLPGVPHEYKKMLREQVLPRIGATRSGRQAIRVIRIFGVGESQLETDIRGVTIPSEIAIGFRATWPELHLRLYAEGEGDLALALDAAETALRERIGDKVFARDEETLAGTVGALLAARGWMLAVAESCTGGLLGVTCTDVPGASKWFESGYVTYSNESKTRMLGVSAAMLDAHGAVSREVAEAMARGAAKTSGAKVAISITGVAGPSGGTPEKPVGTVWIGLYIDGEVTAEKHYFPFDRERVRLRSVWTALDALRRKLGAETEAEAEAGRPGGWEAGRS